MRISRFFFLAMIVLVATSGVGVPVIGKRCPYKFVDVDGRTVSAADRVVTVLVLTSRRGVEMARTVGDRVPERCLGNPASRMITVIRFDQNQNRTVRFVTTALIRRRLDSEAARLKPRYVAKKLTRDPRRDMYAVADFDGQAALQLGLSGSAQFKVLVVSADGTLLREWSAVPTAQELAAVLP